MKVQKLLGVILILTACISRLQAQPFINEINQFKKQDSLHPIKHHPILFVGSSSFTHWKDVQSYFTGYPILNRGFGGSSLPHLMMYADDIIFKYLPRQVVIYCGENDLTAGNHITADSILVRFKRLHQLIRKKLPYCPIVYISMKPSPSRIKYLGTMQEANKKIQQFIRSKRKTRFVNIFDAMLLPNGDINESLFLADRLHMNRQGYQIWAPIIQPYLKK